MPNVFSVPIFFIVFRETLEAAIIISVLLGIVEQIANTRLGRDSLPTTEFEKEKQEVENGDREASAVPPLNNDDTSSDDGERKKFLRKLRLQVCQKVSELSDQPSSRCQRLHRFCVADLHRLCSRSVDCCRDWCGIHRCLVHQSFELVVKVGRIVGGDLFPCRFYPHLRCRCHNA
jgi:hypothetical protein